MYIRPVEYTDISAVTSIFCTAFEHDDFFAHIAPYQHDYPLAWRRYATQKQHAAICKPGMWGLVCVSDGLDGKGAKDEILGYAWWSRKAPANASKTDKYMLNNSSFSATIERFLSSFERKYEEWCCPNPVESRSARDLHDSAAAAMNVLAPLEGVTHWHLSALAVNPQHQRKGVGRMLVDWGVKMATDESLAAPDKPPVPATLTASGPGRILYSQAGFKFIGWKNTLVKDWGRAMLFEPRHYWIDEVHGQEVDAVWTSNALRPDKA